MKTLIKNKAIELQDETIAKIQELVRIDSVRNVAAKEPHKPFGPGIDAALDAFLAMAAELGMRTFKNPDGLYGYAEIGPEETEMLGIIGHIDVVPVNDVSQWTKGLPFSGDICDGKIIGRGTLDDKGPLVVNLMAVKALLASGYQFEKRVRFVVGCAEETTWECIEAYNKLEEMPSMSFSPDAEFPLINAEKTIHHFDIIGHTEEKNYSITSNGAYNAVADSAKYIGNDTDIIAQELTRLGYEYELISGGLNVIGKSAHAMACNKGTNAICRLAIAMYNVGIHSPAIDFLATKVKETYHAELIQGKLIEEAVSGFLTFNIGNCEISKTEERLGCDTRIPVLVDHHEVINKYQTVVAEANLQYKGIKLQEKLYIPEDDFLVATLLKVYEDVTGLTNVKPLSSGGGTYSRAITNCVAFGMLFEDLQEDTMHQPNEALDIKVIAPAIEIYANAIYQLLSK